MLIPVVKSGFCAMGAQLKGTIALIIALAQFHCAIDELIEEAEK